MSLAERKERLLKVARKQKRRCLYLTLYTYAVASTRRPDQKHVVHVSPNGIANWCEPTVDDHGELEDCRGWKESGYCTHSVLAEARYRREMGKRLQEAVEAAMSAPEEPEPEALTRLRRTQERKEDAE